MPPKSHHEMRLELPADLHRRLKVAAAQRGTTLRQLVLDGLGAVADKLERQTPTVREVEPGPGTGSAGSPSRSPEPRAPAPPRPNPAGSSTAG